MNGCLVKSYRTWRVVSKWLVNVYIIYVWVFEIHFLVDMLCLSRSKIFNNLIIDLIFCCTYKHDFFRSTKLFHIFFISSSWKISCLHQLIYYILQALIYYSYHYFILQGHQPMLGYFLHVILITFSNL